MESGFTTFLHCFFIVQALKTAGEAIRQCFYIAFYSSALKPAY